LSEAEFTKAIVQPLTIRFDETPLGDLLGELGRERKLSILIDRRVDPTRRVSWRMDGEPFLEAVADRLEASSLTARAIGSTILVGPEDSLKRLRTLVALRTEELRDKGDGALKARFELLPRRSFDWLEATEPRELLVDLGKKWHVKIEGADRVRYDLWPAGRMTGVNAIEAMSLVLIQFELTFSWDETASTISIQPVPEKVFIRRQHQVPAAKQADLIGQIDQVFKSIDHTLEKERLTVRASIEEQEKIASLLNPRLTKPVTPKTREPLERRRFTWTISGVRIRDALKELENQGITIAYDKEAFAAAGVDLDRRVDLKMDKASAELFATLLCEPLGLEYAIQGTTLTLTLTLKLKDSE
jgi:hypothetical protein